MSRVSGFAFVVCAMWGTVAFGCGGAAEEGERFGESQQAVTIPARGAATTFDVGSWNLEWFGDNANGPSNEPLQLQNARDVIAGTDFDVWGLAEIVSTSQFNSLKSQLSGYAGFLANDASVTSGPSYYGASEQKVGILYKSALMTLQQARIILTSSDDAFAGRPPLEVKLRVTLSGTSQDIVVIVLHAKCCSDDASWQKRSTASAALKSYLDSSYPSQKVLVIGDFNDDLDTSITSGRASPYQAFVNDSADYRFATKTLSDAHIATTVDYPDTIDQHLATNEMYGQYIAESVQAYRVDSYISSYGTTTSDHYPILSRYNWSGGGGGTSDGGTGGGAAAQVVVNEILANEPGSDTAGEFVELLNHGPTAASIGGWTISDATSTRHTFPAGTQLAAGRAIVVFGDASALPGSLGNAVAASSGALSLANGGDTVTLRDASAATKDTFTYGSSLSGTDGVSMNRSPDGSTAGFVLHTNLSSRSSSPGTRVDGSAF
jgi:endonuclease/exonuclease/phosphatase family metal-dependent hydrolase